MACSRQLADGFYLRHSLSLPDPSSDELPSLFRNLLLDFERRLSTKIYDVNRTLTALSSEMRRSVVVENVPNLIYERALAGKLGGKEAVIRTVKELLKVVPPQMVVRKHYAGDFCLAFPVLKCVTPIPATALQDLPEKPLSPHFCAEKHELFVAVQPSPFSDRFVEVFRPILATVLRSIPNVTLSCVCTVETHILRFLLH